MSEKRIKYERTSMTALGRNGTIKQHGISVLKTHDSVLLEPITSRGQIGRCMLEVPREAIPELVKALKKFEWT